MTEPQRLDVAAPAVQLRALTWGPADAPIALCLHGFPDTAYSWRKVAPALVDAGWRVVAPFMRGYVPSSLPSDGSYHVGALMDDALGYYRGIIRGSRPPAQYAELHEHWPSAPRLPTLYLHGTDDGCFEDYTPWIERMLPDGSEIALVKNGGHFLQLDQPDAVARRIVDFVGQAS